MTAAQLRKMKRDCMRRARAREGAHVYLKYPPIFGVRSGEVWRRAFSAVLGDFKRKKGMRKR